MPCMKADPELFPRSFWHHLRVASPALRASRRVWLSRSVRHLCVQAGLNSPLHLSLCQPGPDETEAPVDETFWHLLIEAFQGADPWTQLQQVSLLLELRTAPQQRKAQGIFYTPAPLAEYLAGRSLTQARRFLSGPFPCYDPACGSGLFLWALLRQLKQSLEPRPLAVQAQELASWLELFCGSDLDPLALELTQFGLWWLWQHWFPGSVAPRATLKCLDALSGRGRELSVQQAFPALAAPGLFLSNPPYLGEKNQQQLFRKLRQGPLQDVYRGRSDLYYYFYFLALKLMAPGSLAGLLTPSYFYTATAAQVLRETLRTQTQVLELLDFHELRLFAAAQGQHNQFCLLRILPPLPPLSAPSASSAQVQLLRARASGGLRPVSEIPLPAQFHWEEQQRAQAEIFHGAQAVLAWPEMAWPETTALEAALAVMSAWSWRLGECFQVRQGIVTGADRLSERQRVRQGLTPPVGSGIFVLDAEQAAPWLADPELRPWLRPWFKNSDIYPLQTETEARQWLLYTGRETGTPPAAILQHLEPFRRLLEQRREVQQKRIAWWQLQWPRQESLFVGPKLVLPQRARYLRAALNTEPWFASADVYFILAQPELTPPPLSLAALLVLLNSPLYDCWLYHYGKRKGGILELYYQPLQALPLPPQGWVALQELGQALMRQAGAQALPSDWRQSLHEGVAVAVGLSPTQTQAVAAYYQQRVEYNGAANMAGAQHV